MANMSSKKEQLHNSDSKERKAANVPLNCFKYVSAAVYERERMQCSTGGDLASIKLLVQIFAEQDLSKPLNYLT